MIVYEVYWIELTGEYQMIGTLPERRKNPMRITRNSVMNWAKIILGHDADNEKIFFKQLTIDSLTDRILWHDLSNRSIKITS